MANKLAEMGTVHQKEGGVDVNLKGEVERQKVDDMVQKCSTGTQTCCGPDFFEKVDGIEVEGKDGDVTIHVKGDKVTSGMIEQNLSNCDCYEE